MLRFGFVWNKTETNNWSKRGNVNRQVLRSARLDVALAGALARVGLERISCSVLSGPPRRSLKQALEKSYLATSSAQSFEIKVECHQIGSQCHHTYADADPEQFRRIVPHTQDVRLCCAQRHCERAQVGGVEQTWQCALRRYARIRSHLAVDDAPPHNGQTNKKWSEYLKQPEQTRKEPERSHAPYPMMARMSWRWRTISASSRRRG